MLKINKERRFVNTHSITNRINIVYYYTKKQLVFLHRVLFTQVMYIIKIDIITRLFAFVWQRE